MAGDDKGKTAALVIVSGAAGGLLGALFARRPAQAAPDTEKLDYIASLLETLNTTGESVLAEIKKLTIPGGGAGIVFPESFLTPWVAKEPVQIYQQSIRSIGIFQSDIMVDMRNVKRLAIRAESSLDQAVTLQLIGNFIDSFNLAVNVGPPAACPANGQTEFGLAWGDWRPYIGVIITTAIAPVSGILTIWAVAQE